MHLALIYISHKQHLPIVTIYTSLNYVKYHLYSASATFTVCQESGLGIFPAEISNLHYAHRIGTYIVWEWGLYHVASVDQFLGELPGLRK
ncbi:hypothetical protein BGX38DRAFT_1227729 [Terfezia claveryi]|nr:hypothetical protein BGX38DRAFT_1227729 [Terfezia claveryi]